MVSDETLHMLEGITEHMDTILQHTLIEDQEHRRELGNQTDRTNQGIRGVK